MIRFFIGTLLLGAVTHSVQAQEPAPSLATFPEVLVTATRTHTEQNQLTTASTVYTRADLERLQVNTLPDLLRTTAGLTVTQSGGDGTTASVFMRGTNSDHVLVLVDGIKVGSTTLGTTPYEFVPIDQIERIEIIRGPQSSLYGSEAIGGVIQIFTRQGSHSERPNFSLLAGAGSYDSYRVSGQVNGKWQNSWYSLGASSYGTAGINARQPIPGPFGFNQPDRDGYQNTGMNARAGTRFGDKAELEASFIRAEGINYFDAGFGGERNEFLTQTIALTGKLDVLDNWQSTLRLGQSRDENATLFPDYSLDSQFNSTRWNISWLNDIAISDNHKVLAGADYRLDQIDSTVSYTENSRYDVGIFAEYHGQFWDNHFINGSIRWDSNEQFGDYLTGNIAWRSNWKHGLSTFASFGNAFKAPGFNDLYYPNYGNPNLRPEKSTSVEIGLAGKHDWAQWELRAYHTNIDNLIAPIPDQFFNYSAQNVGKSQIDGLEAEIGAQWQGWNGKLSMSLLNPEIRETNNRLPRRITKSMAFDLSKNIGLFEGGVRVLAQGNRYDDSDNLVKVAGFVTVDLRASYHVNKNWTLNAKLNNLLDKDYQTVATYNSLGRNFFFSVQYNQ